MFKRLRPFLFALALIATVCGLRWPGLGKTVWNLDEGSTFTMAEVVRSGGVMYRDAADNRTPLVPYAKALILEVVGDWNIRGAHIAVAIMIGLTAVWLWRLGRQGRDEMTGALAAVYFALLSFIMLGAVDAMSAHTGWFLIFFSALGMWAFVAALARSSGWLAAIAGTLFAFAGLAKQPGILDGGVCLVLCALVALTAPERRRDCLRLAALFILGFAWPLAATYGYFAAHGAWRDFLQYSWYYNTRLYVPEVPFRERLLAIRTPFQLAQENTPFALWLGIAGFAALIARALPDLWKRPKQLPVLPWLILGWLASGLISTVLSGRDFAHYSIQVLPGLSLACGWVTARAWEKSANWRARGPQIGKWLLRAALGLGGLSLVWTSIHRAATFDLTDGISKDIGLAIKARTRPDARIFVWGYEPELHVFSERLPNTRFIYSVFLTGLIPWTNLDALKNTDYAIIPGAWDAFWHDFTRRPPTMIADTHGNRGFLKYPLRQQKRLWSIIEREYVEVAVDYATARGYTLYQHGAPAPETKLQTLPDDARVQLTAPARSAPATLKIPVNAPAGTTAVDLYFDGRPYRRVENFGSQTVQTSFFVLESDLTLGSHLLRAVARGAQDIASSSHTLTIEPAATAALHFDGPPLVFGSRKIMPVESETITGLPIVLRHDSGQWDAHAPSRLVYIRPDGLTQVDFTFGIRSGAFDGSNPQNTDGVDVSVYFEDASGKQSQLYLRNLDPVGNEGDRKPVTGHANLPGVTGGKIIFRITPGPMNNPAFDWSYWTRIEGTPPPLTLNFRGEFVLPVELAAPFGVTLVDYRQQKVQLIHAPSHFSFKQLPGMTELSGDYGMLDETWQAVRKSNGAVFEVEQILPDGTKRMLFSRTLHPASNADDRGLQSLKVSMPYAAGALIRLTTRAAEHDDNSFNYTFWHELVIGEFPAHLTFEGHETSSIRSEAVNGFNYMDEEGSPVLFAHAPAEIIFPLAPGARRLEGSMGLIRGAYTDKGKTDGAVFIVEVETAEGVRREIFRRHLNPRDVAEDRGAVPFAVDLPVLPQGRLILRTACAPSGKLDFAWSYWGKLQLSR